MNAMMADLSKMMRDFEKAERRVDAQAAKEDPKANKLTQITKAPTTYRSFFGGKNRDGESVYFCVADYVNAAGYILSWRETRVMRSEFSVEVEDTAKRRRRQWAASKSQETMIRLAKRRADKFAARMERVLAERDTKRAAKAKATEAAATAKAARKAKAKAEGGMK
jgi:hypothetical protein